jgi:predicted negative regulator of RcsB-dependent stress response
LIAGTRSAILLGYLSPVLAEANTGGVVSGLTRVRLTSSVPMSDLEESSLDAFANWFRHNQRAVTIAVGAITAMAVGVVVWRKSAETKIANAERAFFQAQTQTAQNPANAAAELEKVATRYAGTSAGDRAALLAAQSLLTRGKAAEAMKKLDALSASGASARLGATLPSLIGAAFETLNKPGDAAKAFMAAAAASTGDAKAQRQADAARAYMAAGNSNEALKLWTELAKDQRGPLAAEAHVRIGELAVKQ